MAGVAFWTGDEALWVPFSCLMNVGLGVGTEGDGEAGTDFARGDGTIVAEVLRGTGLVVTRLRFAKGVSEVSPLDRPFSASRPALTHLLRKALDWLLTRVLL